MLSLLDLVLLKVLEIQNLVSLKLVVGLEVWLALEKLLVIQLRCCDNYLSQWQITAQGSKSLNIEFRVESLQENSTRSLY